MTVSKIVFYGAGSMAEALISGLVRSHLFTPSQIYVTNRSNDERLNELAHTYGVHTSRNHHELFSNATIVFLAMKPKDVETAMLAIQQQLPEHTVIVSMLAGVSISSLASLLLHDNPIIRTMPNTSATIGKSATALTAGEHVSQQQLSLVLSIFKTVGIVEVVEEKHMHAITALSGSGPAYIYYLVEAFEKAGYAVGLEPEVAKSLILQTIVGAAEMLKESPKHPSQLRKEVTSPNGTTEAGITVLENQNFEKAIIQCIQAACERSKQLGMKAK
ncbi:MAG: pyrroline-5-carboxylate reductase [Bacillaceae bacterium]